jgi:hypothetical protein
MSDSRGAWGWGQPTPPASVRSRRERRGLLAFVLLGALLALVAFLLLRGGGTATPGTNPWAGGAGASVRSDFLARCRLHGSSAAFCVCAFDEIRATPPYSTPAQFTALDPESTTPSAAATGALTRASQSCAPSSVTAPAPAPVASPTASPAGRAT